jgi:hypothetical protein
MLNVSSFTKINDEKSDILKLALNLFSVKRQTNNAVVKRKRVRRRTRLRCVALTTFCVQECLVVMRDTGPMHSRLAV